MKKAAVGAMLVVALGGVLTTLLYLYGRANVDPIAVGSPLPDISLLTRSSIPVSLQSILLRKALVLFFTVDCPHCVTELLHFAALHGDKKDSLQFLFVSFSSADETRQFFSTWRNDIPLVLADPEGAKRALGITTLPMLLLVDGGGRVVYRRSGERSFAADERLVHTMIREGLPCLR